jgi:hypothetical protein
MPEDLKNDRIRRQKAGLMEGMEVNAFFLFAALLF